MSAATTKAEGREGAAWLAILQLGHVMAAFPSASSPCPAEAGELAQRKVMNSASEGEGEEREGRSKCEERRYQTSSLSLYI